MATEVIPGVYDITCRDDESGKRYRTFLFVNGTPTLFDTGLESTTDVLLDAIEEIGVTPERQILTHGDGDHIGGYDAVVEAFDVTTWVPIQTDVDERHSPDHRYGDGDEIGRFVAVHLPGHKPDNYALVDTSGDVAVLGDAVSGSDQRGLPAGYFHLPPGTYSTDLNRAEESLERLLEFEFDVGLVFHGSSVTADATEKLSRYVNFPGK